MRRRSVIVVLAAVLVLLAGFAIAIWRTSVDTVNNRADSKAGATLPTRTVDAAGVAVKIEPQQIDATGAAFRISFDTHSVDLEFDVTQIAHLTVADAPWTASSWAGDGPGGHHRSGLVRFSSGGAPAGTAVLHLSGLPEPVVASWTLIGGG
jgi:hypothetical protein